MKRKGVVLAFVLLSSVFFGTVSGLWGDDFSSGNVSPSDFIFFNSPYGLDWALDGCGVGMSTGIFVLGRVLYNSKPNPSVTEIKNLNRDNIFIVDRELMTDYSPYVGWASDIAKDISVSLPVLLIASSLWQYYRLRGDLSGNLPFGQRGYSAENALAERLTEIVIMYYESLMLALGIKDSLKGLVTRFRPYAYGSVLSVEEIASNPDSTCSFPSGHTTAAFVGAVFLSTVFSDYYPDSPLKLPVWLGSLMLAATTGALRIASGNHFLSDVVAGAVIGAVSVIGVRYLHVTIKFPPK